jgi:polar amino acid transport system ATP-binding protein
MPPGEFAVQAQGVHKFYGSHHALRGIDLEVRRGQVIVVLGPSGSGKSTFLRCLNHLEAIERGSIRVCGELVGYRETPRGLVELGDAEVARARRRIGMVFQQFNLFPHLSALRNITVGPRYVLREDREAAEAEARRLLTLVGLPEKAEAYPTQLSGGQQQRVAIARALAMRPEVMLFDEPTSALDPEMISEVLEVMTALSKQGMTMIVVTHEMGFARAVANRVVLVDEGRVVEDAAPGDFFTTPQHERTRAFLDKILH